LGVGREVGVGGGLELVTRLDLREELWMGILEPMRESGVGRVRRVDVEIVVADNGDDCLFANRYVF